MRFGIGVRLAPGVRLWVPLGSRRRRRAATRRVFVHPGCTVNHRSRGAAERCEAKLRAR